MLVDLRPKRITGKAAEAALGRAHLTVNKNGIPFDPEKADGDVGHPGRDTGRDLAGLRHGRVRARRSADRRDAGRACGEAGDAGNAKAEASVREGVTALTARFPIY